MGFPVTGPESIESNTTAGAKLSWSATWVAALTRPPFAGSTDPLIACVDGHESQDAGQGHYDDKRTGKAVLKLVDRRIH